MLMAAALVLVGCGGNVPIPTTSSTAPAATKFSIISTTSTSLRKSPTSSTTTSTSPASTSTTPTTEPLNPAKDKATAQQMVLTADDMPSGWTDESSGDGDDLDASDINNDGINSCLGLPPTSQMLETSASGDGFSQASFGSTPSIAFIGTEIDVEKSLALAKDVVTAFSNSKNYSCLQQATQTQTTTIDKTTVTSVTKVPGLKLSSNEFSLRMNLQSVAPGYLDIVGVQNGRYVSTYMALYMGTQPPLSLEQDLLSKLAAHSTAAGA
jgi:hypothetical protein